MAKASSSHVSSSAGLVSLAAVKIDNALVDRLSEPVAVVKLEVNPKQLFDQVWKSLGSTSTAASYLANQCKTGSDANSVSETHAMAEATAAKNEAFRTAMGIESAADTTNTEEQHQQSEASKPHIEKENLPDEEINRQSAPKKKSKHRKLSPDGERDNDKEGKGDREKKSKKRKKRAHRHRSESEDDKEKREQSLRKGIEKEKKRNEKEVDEEVEKEDDRSGKLSREQKTHRHHKSGGKSSKHKKRSRSRSESEQSTHRRRKHSNASDSSHESREPDSQTETNSHYLKKCRKLERSRSLDKSKTGYSPSSSRYDSKHSSSRYHAVSSRSSRRKKRAKKKKKTSYKNTQSPLIKSSDLCKERAIAHVLVCGVVIYGQDYSRVPPPHDYESQATDWVQNLFREPEVCKRRTKKCTGKKKRQDKPREKVEVKEREVSAENTKTLCDELRVLVTEEHEETQGEIVGVAGQERAVPADEESVLREVKDTPRVVSPPVKVDRCSPHFMERRRITSARKKPVPYPRTEGSAAAAAEGRGSSSWSDSSDFSSD